MANYFDLLFVASNVETPSESYYRVLTISAPSEAAAIVKGKKMARSVFRDEDGRLFRQRFCNAGPAGSMDKFISKYVGEFIDRAYARGDK